MNLRKFLIPTLLLFFITFSCRKDDELEFESIPERERQEVSDENEIEIQTYLETHFFNSGDFDFTNASNPANDDFTLVLDTISLANGTLGETPLINYTSQPSGLYPRLDVKVVNLDDIDYNLYILKVREGQGDNINSLDRAVVVYSGTVTDGSVFDSQVDISNGQPFNLTPVGNIGGVVSGFREGIIEFKTSTGYTENVDGSITYHNHGIGVVFMPSGLAYFSSPPPTGVIPQYSPLFFNLKVISRSNTDWDLDGVPSHLEHLDGDFTGTNDDTDEDTIIDMLDSDDDGDGVLTSNEVIKMEYEDDGGIQFMTRADAQTYYTVNAALYEEFISIEGELDGTFKLHTLIIPDDNNDGIPNYLDNTVTTSL